jgi:hypothetical protein
MGLEFLFYVVACSAGMRVNRTGEHTIGMVPTAFPLSTLMVVAVLSRPFIVKRRCETGSKTIALGPLPVDTLRTDFGVFRFENRCFVGLAIAGETLAKLWSQRDPGR